MVRKYFEYHEDFEFEPKKNEKGEYVCLNCGVSLAFNKRRRKWCSDKCNVEYYEKHTSSWNIIRWKAFERDDFKCQNCGIEVFLYPKVAYNAPNMAVGDHIIPIWKGGAEFDLNNVQTLCYKCSQKKTRREAKERTKIARLVIAGVQRQLPIKVMERERIVCCVPDCHKLAVGEAEDGVDGCFSILHSQFLNDGYGRFYISLLP